MWSKLGAVAVLPSFKSQLSSTACKTGAPACRRAFRAGAWPSWLFRRSLDCGLGLGLGGLRVNEPGWGSGFGRVGGVERCNVAVTASYVLSRFLSGAVGGRPFDSIFEAAFVVSLGVENFFEEPFL